MKTEIATRTPVKMKHVVSSHDIKEPDIQNLFDFADKAKSNLENGKHWSSFPGNKILTTLFYEPSTRTRLGFESAMIKLGGNVISVENVRNSTCDLRGETLEDIVASVSCYSDVIALRHPEPGSAVKASDVSKCPIINCRDGNNEHPIQALQDMYTIQRLRPDAKTIMFIGDISGSAVVTSLMHFADMFDMHIYYTGQFRPQQLPTGRHTSVSELQIGGYLDQADVVYMLPSNPGGTVHKFKLTLDYLEAIRKDALIMHHFPRGKEMPRELDKDPRCVYFEQSRNGLFIRMAILNHVLGK
jgi:aspartate carbamoyltransferase catalytic subunit